MGKPKYSVSKDANHDAIVADLRRIGLFVYDTSKSGEGFPDLFAINKKKTVVLVELKIDGKADIKKTQMLFIGKYPGFVGFAKNTDEAVRLIVEPELFGLTPAQKAKILSIGIRCKTKAMNFNTFWGLVNA